MQGLTERGTTAAREEKSPNFPQDFELTYRDTTGTRTTAISTTTASTRRRKNKRKERKKKKEERVIVIHVLSLFFPILR